MTGHLRIVSTLAVIVFAVLCALEVSGLPHIELNRGRLVMNLLFFGLGLSVWGATHERGGKG